VHHPELAEHPLRSPPAQSAAAGQDNACKQLWSAQQRQAADRRWATGREGIRGCTIPCSDVPHQIWPEVTWNSSEEGA